MARFNRIHFLIFIAVLFIAGCRKDPSSGTINPTDYNPDWTDASHGSSNPDYALVFPSTTVNRIDLVIGTDGWNRLKSNMFSIFGIGFGQQQPGNINSDNTVESEYVEAELSFNQKKWKHVGFRLRGNSTLYEPWNDGNYKLPFKLNFDKFEDQYPGIQNQHFYGFEELTFAAGYGDQSLIREKLAADLYRMGGVPTAQTAFCRVYVDIGNGLKYWGLYTCIELPEDNMIKHQIGEESGNIYKPESRLNLFDLSEFEKKNNFDSTAYTDAISLINKLNSPQRISNPVYWKSELDKIIDTDEFLNWLAINNAIVNWDSYGASARNYYLYHRSDGRFIWIPWDNNEALKGSPGIVGSPGGNGENGRSLSMNEVTANWPLIRYLADDAAYMQRYKDHLRSFKTNHFNVGQLQNLIETYYTLITPFVTGVDGETSDATYLNNNAAFLNEKIALKNHISVRAALLNTYVP